MFTIYPFLWMNLGGGCAHACADTCVCMCVRVCAMTNHACELVSSSSSPGWWPKHTSCALPSPSWAARQREIAPPAACGLELSTPLPPTFQRGP